jgi:trans-aconitate methyltransferase
MFYVYIILLIILLLIIFIGGIAFTLTVVGFSKTEVPFLPIPRKLLPHITTALKLSSTSVLYDLGCGNSIVLRYLLKHSPVTKATGVEIAPLPYLLAKIWNRVSPLTHLEIRRGDFMETNLHDATHIFLYLFPSAMENLIPKLTQELTPGTRVISCDFPFNEKTPKEIIEVTETYFPHKLYVYEF